MDEWREVPANRLAAWADEMIEALDTHEDVDRSLRRVLRRTPDLREETTARMAEALRAAALGLTPAACALSAGVSERLLLSWQTQDPPFAAAMTAARELARAHVPASPAAALNPAALRVLLASLRTGALHAQAAALVGMSGRALYRLRRESPGIAALAAAARRARPKKADRRRKPKFEQRYRLIRMDEEILGRLSLAPAPVSASSAASDSARRVVRGAVDAPSEGAPPETGPGA